MKTKLLLYPNNTIIFIKNNYIYIKGPFNALKIPLVQDNAYNLLYNFQNIQLILKYNDFNILKLHYKKKNYFITYFINLLKKYIDIVSTGYLNILQLWGIGYKISKKDYFSILNLGYSHVISLIDFNLVFTKPINNIYIFNTSTTKQKLLQNTSYYRNLRKKDVYKGKGVRQLNEKVTLKIGKRD